MNTEAPFKTYLCLICGYIYDEEQGDPEEGLAPGTRRTCRPYPHPQPLSRWERGA